MRDLQGLFDEFSAALQFPSYFGNNGGAFFECIQEIPDWLPFGYGYVIVVEDSDQIQNDDDWLEFLVSSLADAAVSYAQPLEQGHYGDRAPVPFHVVLQEEPSNEKPFKEWAEAGAVIQQIQLT